MNRDLGTNTVVSYVTASSNAYVHAQRQEPRRSPRRSTHLYGENLLAMDSISDSVMYLHKRQFRSGAAIRMVYSMRGKQQMTGYDRLTAMP